MTVPANDEDVAGRRVPASHGLGWLRQGLATFAATPTTWVAMVLLFMTVAIVLGIIPFASMLFSVAVPILLGGVVIGCERQRLGGALEVRHLFSGFEQPFLQPLALLGALMLAGTIVVSVPAVALVVMGMMTTAAVGAVSPTAGLGALVVLATVIALIILASVALSLAFWFAPALVVLRGDPPLDALKISLRAAVRNIPAFLLYGVAVFGLGLVTMSPLLAAILLAARLPHESASVAFIAVGGTALFALCGMVVIMPTTWAAMYASYRDVFEE